MKTLILIFSALLICGTTSFGQKTEDFPPQWYNNPPKSRKILYAVGYGTSVSQQIAFEKAKMAAYKELSEQLSAITIKTNKKKTEATTQATLREVEIEDKASRQDSTGRYEAYILVSHKKPKKQ